jgi:dTDP-glucose 4,6-dehydratase
MELKNINLRKWLVTGGAGFIGSNFILAQFTKHPPVIIINLDKLTYAGNPDNLKTLEGDENYIFVHGDIGDGPLVRHLLQKYRPDGVINFAAESHVDRSIRGPQAFIQTNVVGTFSLLDEVRHYWEGLDNPNKEAFRFLQVSTDEVYGSLGPEDPPFTEVRAYAPNSPYSASKAAGDYLVRAYHKTHGLPTLITNCSNNYGPFQFPEKLIPLMMLNALQGKPLPIYGDGKNIRDWLYVEDHCESLRLVLEQGRVGETYNIGGGYEKTNLEVVHSICNLLDGLYPDSPYRPHAALITFVKDRPGHDRRYAIDCAKIRGELGWQPQETFQSGLLKTVRWYLSHQEWVSSVQTGAYREWIRYQYGKI